MNTFRITATLICALGQFATPAKAESQAALNGALYTVISHMYAGEGGSLSYVRLVNSADTKNKFSISVVGSPSGRTYGTTDIEVNPSASPQYSLTQILSLAGAGNLTGGDTGYSLYLQNPEHLTGYQHVVFNGVTRSFENASACSSLLIQHQIPEALSVTLPNVHTSRLAEYPSQVLIHNYWDLPVTYRVTVADAVTGNVIGAVDIATAANSSYSFPFSFSRQN